MTAILTETRDAVWACLNGHAALNPTVMGTPTSVFTTRFSTDALMERYELAGPYLHDLPCCAIRWASFDATWKVNQGQTWDAAIVIETHWPLSGMANAEQRAQDIIEAVGRYSQGGGVNYLQSVIGHYPKNWGPISVEAVELRSKHKAWKVQVAFILPHFHNPIKG